MAEPIETAALCMLLEEIAKTAETSNFKPVIFCCRKVERKIMAGLAEAGLLSAAEELDKLIRVTDEMPDGQVMITLEKEADHGTE